MHQWHKRENLIDYLPKGRNAYFRIVLQRAYEEILTLHRLGLLEKLGRSLKTSNRIESLMAIIGQRTDKVDSWRINDQKQRWLTENFRKEVVSMNFDEENYGQIIEKAAQLGYENELKYFGCSQAVVSALIESFGIGGPDILRASTALGAGIARRGNVCGALVGGLMMIGLLVGRDDLDMDEQYQRGQAYGDKLYRRFEEKFGTAICVEIHKMKFGKTFDMQTEKGRELFVESGGHDPEGCPSVTKEGARLAAALIVEIFKEGCAMARIVSRCSL